jgi:hypothetical protein
LLEFDVKESNSDTADTAVKKHDFFLPDALPEEEEQKVHHQVA